MASNNTSGAIIELTKQEIDNLFSGNDLNTSSFKNQVINFVLFFPNFLYRTKREDSRNKVCSTFIEDRRGELESNLREIGGGITNTQWLLRGDNYKTDFIEVNKNDFLKFFEAPNGFDGSKTLTSNDIDVKNLEQSYGEINTPSAPPNFNGSEYKLGKQFFSKGLISDILKQLLKKKIV